MRILLASILIFGGFHAFAEDDASPAAPAPAVSSADSSESKVSDDYKSHHFTIKGGTTDYHYEEPGLMKIHGRLYQVETGYRSKFGHSFIPFIFGGNLSFATGTTTYDGGLNHAGTVIPVSNDSNEKLYDLEGFFGASFFDSRMQALDVYVGLGIWYLDNKIDGTGSYRREITYIYLPTGVRYNFKPTSSIKLYVGALYDVFVGGSVKTHLSDLSSSYDDVTNTQTGGSGFKLNTGFEFTQPGWSVFAEGVYQAWSIDDSSVEYSGGAFWREPHNTTKMLSINLGARF